MMIDLDKPITQRQFAILVRTSREAVSKLSRKGILKKGASAGDWIAACFENYRKLAAGWKSSNGNLDLIQERARLAAAQADKTIFELRKARGEFIPVCLAAEAIEKAILVSRAHLLALPNKLKSYVPELSPEVVSIVDDLIRESLQELSTKSLPRTVRKHLRDWEIEGKEPG